MHESLPIYSGGLGILAGDHCKAASDRRLPFVAVGLLYRQGYFVQTMDLEGNQRAEYVDSDFDDLPITPARTADGAAARRRACRSRRDACSAKVWHAQVGHVTLYLLDTGGRRQQRPRPRHRAPALRRRRGDAPRAGDRARHRRRARARGARHRADRVAHQRRPRGVPGDRACARPDAARARLRRGARSGRGEHGVHHAHAGAGGPRPLPRRPRSCRTSSRSRSEAGLPVERLRDLGRAPGGNDFNMTALALRGSRYHNGVSRIHGRVSSRMLQEFWPQVPRGGEPDRAHHQRRARADVPRARMAGRVRPAPRRRLDPPAARSGDRRGRSTRCPTTCSGACARSSRRRCCTCCATASRSSTSATRAARRTSTACCATPIPANPERAHRRLRAALRDVQARDADAAGARPAARARRRPRAAGALRLRGQGASGRPAGPGDDPRDRAHGPRSASSKAACCCSKATTCTPRAGSCPASTCGSTIRSIRSKRRARRA